MTTMQLKAVQTEQPITYLDRSHHVSTDDLVCENQIDSFPTIDIIPGIEKHRDLVSPNWGSSPTGHASDVRVTVRTYLIVASLRM